MQAVVRVANLEPFIIMFRFLLLIFGSLLVGLIFPFIEFFIGLGFLFNTLTKRIKSFGYRQIKYDELVYQERMS